MKNVFKGPLKILTIPLFFLCLGGLVSPALAQLSFPAPSGWVNDFAGILSEETVAELETRLDTLEKGTGIEMAVVTVDSLQGTTVEDFAVRLFEEWGIGKADQDNGALLLIAPNEREMRIEVGYGLEPVLTDSKAGRIIRNIITPSFKVMDYDLGVKNGVLAMIGVVEGEEVDLGSETVPSSTDGAEEGDSGAWIVFGLMFLFFAIVDYGAGFLGRSKDWWLGGILGAGLGLIIGLLVWGLLKGFLAGIGAGLFGLLLDYILSGNYQKRKKRGLPTSWWSSWGGFSSGSSGGGGSSFGGFGGGSSGGGGASGSW